MQMLSCHTVSYFGLPYYHNNNVYNVIAIFKAGASIPLANLHAIPPTRRSFKEGQGSFPPESAPTLSPN